MTRLRREWQSIILDPPQHIQVSVNESDMLEWHYLIEGPKDTPYAGGWQKFILYNFNMSTDLHVISRCLFSRLVSWKAAVIVTSTIR